MSMILRNQVVIYNQPGAMAEATFRDVIQKSVALDMDDVRQQIEADAEDVL
jgi:thioredoxin 1